MSNLKFFVCKKCGNLVTKINDAGMPLNCCGETMVELIPNTTDAAVEKHVPVLEVNGDTATVNVSSVTHPMTNEHYIDWICLETTKGFSVKKLTPEDKPVATFKLGEEKVVGTYAHCNLHGLWKA